MVDLTTNRRWVFPLMTLRIILVTICVPKVAQAVDDNREKKFCLVEVSINLTTASTNASDFLTISHYLFPWPTDTFKAVSLRSQTCYLKPSLPLCPAHSGTNTEEIYVVDDDMGHAKIREDEPGHGKRFHVLFGDRCSGKREYFFKTGVFEDNDFHLLGNGSQHPPQVNQKIRSLGYEKYCLIMRLEPSSSVPMICFPTPDWIDLSDLLAVPFLVVTVLVYSILPEFKNIHGATLRCYLYCIIATHVTLTTHRMIRPYYSDSPSCLCLVFAIYFSLFGSLMWLNVICIDMWWRFGGSGSLYSRGKQHDRKKFFWYSFYAWGVTIIITSTCIGMEFCPGVPESLVRPGFRSGECWFDTNASRILYMVAPVGVMIACNIFLFISTSINILRHKQNLRDHLENGDSRRYDNNKQWFVLYLRVFVVMGICWSTNIAFMLFIPEKYLGYFTSTVAQLQGFLVFGIFVCKKNVWMSLKERCNNKKLHNMCSQFCYLSTILRCSTESKASAAVNEVKQKNTSLDSSVYSISCQLAQM